MLRYDELTYPEVEALPRSTPWTIPLGEAVVEGRNLLPAIPFGWELPEPVWTRWVQSLFAVLREDGWEDVELAGPVEPPGGLPWRYAPGALPGYGRAPLYLVPIGHTEQHGFHLPLSTDTLLVEALAHRARISESAILPAFPYGVSMHRRQYPGTLSVDPRAFEDFWTAVCGQLVSAGAEAIYLLNGHGGNHSFLVNVTKFAGERWPECFTAHSFLHTSSGAAYRKLLDLRESTLMGHACELETSMVMALRPDLVHLERAVDEVDFLETPDYRMDWVEEGALIANPPWSDDTRTGTYGAPRCSTAEKGRAWLEASGQELARLAAQVLEQSRKRRQRREQGWTEGAWRATSSELAPPRRPAP